MWQCVFSHFQTSEIARDCNQRIEYVKFFMSNSNQVLVSFVSVWLQFCLCLNGKQWRPIFARSCGDCFDGRAVAQLENLRQRKRSSFIIYIKCTHDHLTQIKPNEQLRIEIVPIFMNDRSTHGEQAKLRTGVNGAARIWSEQTRPEDICAAQIARKSCFLNAHTACGHNYCPRHAVNVQLANAQSKLY